MDSFVIRKICHACAFYCILINVSIFAHFVPSSSSSSTSSSNSILHYPGGMSVRNSSYNLRMAMGLHDELQRSFVANLTQCAEDNQTFCTKNDNYPTEHVRRLLQQHSHRYADHFVNDAVAGDVSIRVDDFDIEHLCDSYEKVIYPTSGKAQDGSERYIVNTDEFKQGVRVSICRTGGQACKMTDSFPSGYKTECRQQMVYRQLLSLAPNGDSVKNLFEFPACCSCILYRVN